MNVFQHLRSDQIQQTTRRHFLLESAMGLGGIYLASQNQAIGAGSTLVNRDPNDPFAALVPPLPAKAKRVIFIHLAGGPSQLELFDHKPELDKYDGKDCPDHYLEGQRFAFIVGRPKMMGSLYKFKKHGESGATISDRLPYIAEVADDLCFIKSMVTNQFNHAPAQLMVQTGNANLGHPSIGAWTTYGLGSENQNLPGFIVLLSRGVPRLGKTLWGSGFLPSVYQGVNCRSVGDPVLNIKNPDYVTQKNRRAVLNSLKVLNEKSHKELGDRETITRISQYEMTYNMQMEAPEVMNINEEPKHIQELYGATPGQESFANNCLMARRLAESGVRFIQLYDRNDWDGHGSSADNALNRGFIGKCQQVDKPVAALIKDLKQRGMLKDTLVIWGSEFGRTSMRENGNASSEALLGRDHNPNAFTFFMAGAGVKAGFTYGETDEMGYIVARDPVHVRDFHATLLHLLGHDHKRLSVPYQGLDQKLTGVKEARVVKGILP